MVRVEMPSSCAATDLSPFVWRQASRGSRGARPRRAACRSAKVERVTSVGSRGLRLEGLGQVASSRGVACDRHDRALDHVLELAHVPGPRILESASDALAGGTIEPRARSSRNRRRRSDRRAAGCRPRRCPQRRRRHGDHVEPIVQVLAEAPAWTSARRSRLVAATIRTSARTVSPPTGSYSPSCSTRRASPARAGESSPISSRKSVPPAARAKRPSRFADRARERAALVAEELGLEDRLGDRRAVHRDERAPRAAARRGCSARGAPCRCRSRPRRAPSRGSGRGLGRHVEHAAQRRRVCPTISRLVSSFNLSCFKRLVLGDERVALHRLAYALHDREALERLLDEVVRALAHGLTPRSRPCRRRS
jgi:hypothetical protein